MKVFFGFALALLWACAPQAATPTTLPNFSPLSTQVAEPSTSPTSTRPSPVSSLQTPTLSFVTRLPSPTSTKPAIQTPAWFNDVVLYEIFPRSFYDADDDGIGDLKGIEQKLDYIKSLGVGALWLTPIFASPSYHGYDITNYYKINPEFGATQDLIDLVDAAHAREIKVILDFVAGHASDQHPFFQDAYGNPNSKYADWFIWLDDAHTKYEHFGSATDMPKWNQDNPATRAYLIDAAKTWMQTTGVDGYRLDYALGASHSFWKEFRQELKTVNPDALLLGEVWASGLKIAPFYDNEFDATFSFPIYFDIMGSHDRAGNSMLLGNRAPASFQSALQAQTRLYPPGAQSVYFLSNHDTLRVASQVGATCQASNAECPRQNLERAKLAATLLFTLPATPMLYYGEEIGMRGDKRDGDKTVREPMDWYAAETGVGMPTWYRPASRLNAANDGVSVQEEQARAASLFEHYRALSALRAEQVALRRGAFSPVPLQGSDRATAYARVADDKILIVVLNTADEAADVTLDLGAFASDTIKLAALWGEIQTAPAPAQNYPLRLAPRAGYIFELKP